MDQSSECQLVLHGMPECTEDNFAGPDGFVQSLRELYNRSSWELGLEAEVVEKCLNELDQSTPFRLLTDKYPSTHTKAMWRAGRLDLTLERLALSGEWRGGFLEYDIQEVSRNLRALEALRLARNEPGRIVELDKDVEDSGYRLRSVYGAPYLTCRQVSLSGYNLPFSIYEQQCCESVRSIEEELEAFLVLFAAPLYHLLSCEECAENAPNARLLGGFLLNEAIDSVGSMLRNLIECLDLSEGKLKLLAQHNAPGKYYWVMQEAATARAFFMALYVPHVSVDLVNCLAPDENALKLLDDSGSGMDGVMERMSRTSEYSHDFNPWIRLRDGYGLPEAVRFIGSLSEEAFEAGLLSHELYNVSDEADTLAYRWAWPWRRRFIPSTQENLVPIPGFLDVVQGATTSDWNRFLSQTLPANMPDWGFWAFGSMLGLAAKSAKHQLRSSSLSLDTARVLTSLEQIGEQTHSIYGAQLPMMELVSEAIRSVRKVEEQQVASAPLLDRVVQLLGRPGREHAERSLQELLGDVYRLLTPEAKAAAIEGELRFQQRDCVDAAVIPFQFAKAFECQLRANVTLPYFHRERTGRYELTPSELRDALKREEPNVLGFLLQRGFEAPRLLSALERIQFNRNRAAHQARMTLVEAEEIRADWLGIGDRATSVFYPLVPRTRT